MSFFPAQPATTVITDFKIWHIRIVKQLFVSPGVKSKYYSAMLGISNEYLNNIRTPK